METAHFFLQNIFRDIFCSKFGKNSIRLVQVMAIFVSGAKRKLMAEEKYEENKFDSVYLKDGCTKLAQIWYRQ